MIPPLTIDGFVIDVAVTEDYNFDCEVTKHPVESGADVTDHVRELPKVITLDCIVSDTPLGDLLFQRDVDTIPSDEAYAHLLGVKGRRRPVTIETKRGVFDNMVIRNLRITETAANGDALRFTVTLEELVLKTNLRTTVRVAVPRAAKKVNLGQRAAPAAGVDEGAPPASAQASADVKKGYRDSWLGQLTDFAGITN